MTEEQLIEQIILHAFNDELQKVAAQRGLDFAELQKEAGFLGDLAKNIGKKGRAALVGLGLAGAPAAGHVGEQAAKAVTHVPAAQASKYVEGLGQVSRGSQTQARSAPGWRVNERAARSGAAMLGSKVDPKTIKTASIRALLQRLRA